MELDLDLALILLPRTKELEELLMYNTLIFLYRELIEDLYGGEVF